MFKLNVLIGLGVITLVSGCAAIDQSELRSDAEKMRERITVQKQVQASQSSRPLYEKKKGSYVGAHPVPLAYAASLPAIFRDKEVTLNFPARRNIAGKVNLATVAARITDVTRIPVRISPDVYVTNQELLNSKQTNQLKDQSALNNAGPTPPFPGPMDSTNNAAHGMSTTMVAESDRKLPMEYSGNLAGYLDFICARLGINWEYKDGGIVMYRLKTETFVVKVNPGDLQFKSSVQKGASSSTASAGTTETTGSGSFEADTAASVAAEFSSWKSMEQAINGMKSGIGHITIDQSAGLVIATDTKQSLEAIEAYIATINDTLTRQIDIEIRTMTVSTSADQSADFNINLLYEKLNGGVAQWGLGITSPSSLINAAEAGGVALAVLRPTSRFKGSTLVAQALNELGTVIADTTRSATTTNRVPVPIARFTTEGYLAATTPAAAGGDGGISIPGLTPGSLTTGSFVSVLPSAYANGSVLLRLSFDDTVSRGFGTITTGSGATLQQIQTPTFTGSKSDHSVGLKDGESLVLMANSIERSSGDKRFSLTGFSGTTSRVRETEIIIVTPRVRAGI